MFVEIDMESGPILSRATEIDVSEWDTDNVVNMTGMFGYTQATEIKGLSSLEIGNVTNMFGMFDHSAATTIDLRGLDTSKVTSMNSMFLGSAATTGYARTQEDADKFNDASVTDIPSTLTFIVKSNES